MLARLRGVALLALAFVLLLPAAAFAGDTSTVTLPIGDWIAEAFTIAIPVILAWILRQLPAAIVQQLRTKQAEQLINMAVSYALNAVAGAAKGRVLSVDVGNAVVAEALGYIVAHGPAKLIGWLGGEAAIQQKIIARLALGSEAEVVAAPDLGAVIVTAAPPA